MQQSHPEDTALRENLKNVMTTGEADFLLAVDDSRRGVGYIQQRYRYSLWLGGMEATLEDLFVLPAERRQGVATQLVESAIKRAMEKGCQAMKLDTNENNYGAIQLYRRLGFLSGSTSFSDSRQLSFEKLLGPV